MMAACDFGVCFSGGEFKMNSVSLYSLVPVFRTEEPREMAGTMF